MKSLLVDNMLTWVFSVFEEKCVTHELGGHEHLLIATTLQLGLHFITCCVLLGGQLFLQGSAFFGVRSFIACRSHFEICFSCARVVIFLKTATTTELLLTA